jgi:hypothetical protein
MTGAQRGYCLEIGSGLELEAMTGAQRGYCLEIGEGA